MRSLFETDSVRRIKCADNTQLNFSLPLKGGIVDRVID